MAFWFGLIGSGVSLSGLFTSIHNANASGIALSVVSLVFFGYVYLAGGPRES